jgi:hypothetical protein
MNPAKNDSERVMSLASKIIVEIGRYAAKIRASGQESRQNYITFNVTNLQRVIHRSHFPRMEEVKQGIKAWVVGPVPQPGKAQQLCVDSDGHGYITSSPRPQDNPERLTIHTLATKDPEQLEAIHQLIINAR